MDDFSGMSDLAMWSLLIGAVAPALVSAIKRQGWNDAIKTLVSMIIFAVFGFGIAYFSGHFNGRSIVSSVLLVSITAYALYQNFYKPTGIDRGISNITERKENRV